MIEANIAYPMASGIALAGSLIFLMSIYAGQLWPACVGLVFGGAGFGAGAMFWGVIDEPLVAHAALAFLIAWFSIYAALKTNYLVMYFGGLLGIGVSIGVLMQAVEPDTFHRLTTMLEGA